MRPGAPLASIADETGQSRIFPAAFGRSESEQTVSRTALFPDGPASRPEPTEVAVSRFMLELRALRTENGAPSYAVLSRRTGLPRSTVYDALRRDRLPPLDTTLALVSALGGDPVRWRRRWAELRSELDAPAPSAPAPPTGPGRSSSLPPGTGAGAQPDPGRTLADDGRTNPDGGRTVPDGGRTVPDGGRSARPRRSRRRWLVAALTLALLAAGVVGYAAWPSSPGCHRAQLYTVTSAGDLLDASGHTIGKTQSGDTVEVTSHKHDAFAHRLLGTVERTGAVGYVDEARVDPARTVCS